ncbi:MAG TPA: hypothetical protein VHV74_23225 [Pseudonocardiaceae bacterium]|jgi:hypothetical protein|nr:hypothetical protein [Pseudonocardiaceae bacterium]
MNSRWARLGAATAVAVAVTAGSILATEGSATGAAAPVVIGSCSTTVKGDPGTPVELSPSAVVSPIANLVGAVPILGPTLESPFRSAFDALPPIPIGSLPTGTSTITGGQIANAVNAQLTKLPLLGPVIGSLTGKVQTTLASLCGVTVQGVTAVVAPVQSGTSTLKKASKQAQQRLGLAPQTGSGSGGGGAPVQQSGGGSSGGGGAQQGGGGSSGSGLPAPNSPVVGGLPPGLTGLGTAGGFGAGTLLDYGLAESPLARYAGIPFASSGLFDPAPGVKYGGSVPGYAPSSGQLGENDGLPSDGVQTAGHAEAFAPAAGTLGNGVGLPMLLAVLLLAGVTAALVRTWVLRKVRSA